VQDDGVTPDDRGLEDDGPVVQWCAERAHPADPMRSVIVVADQPDRHLAVRPDPDGGAVRVAAGDVTQVDRELGTSAAPGLVRELERDPQALVGDLHRVQRRSGGPAAGQWADRAAPVPDREVGAPGVGADRPRAAALGLAEAGVHVALEGVAEVEHRVAGGARRAGLQRDEQADGGQQDGAENGDPLLEGESGGRGDSAGLTTDGSVGTRHGG
jgi:hypothetical protein